MKKYIYLFILGTGEKPFECSKSDDAFIQNIALPKHMKSSHDEGMFKCKFWNEDFVQEIHLKRQNPFECMVCMKKFALERDKKKHMREEHEERVPYNIGPKNTPSNAMYCVGLARTVEKI